MSGSSLTEDAWLKHCRCTLVWATRLMTFSKYLQAESDIYSIALSLIIELPPTVEVFALLNISFIDLVFYIFAMGYLHLINYLLLMYPEKVKKEKRFYGVFSLIFQCGMLLSEYFYDVDSLEPEIQEKLQGVLKDWQGVFLDGKGMFHFF